MSSITNQYAGAQIALGKFHLHPWDSQVLVDWAKSTTDTVANEASCRTLSEMDRASREEILQQFQRVMVKHDFPIVFDVFTAISAYLENLRTRVLAGEIEPTAAFAQVRPLAYDLEGIQLTGLSELDEDLNLVDSGEPAFHHPALEKSNRDVFICTFFRQMEVLPPLPIAGGSEAPVTDFDRALMSQLENMALAMVIALITLYLFLVLMGFR